MRRVAVFIAAALAFSGAVPAQAAPEQSLAEKRAEARRLERQIEELGRRASIVLEDFNEATDRYEEASARLHTVQVRVKQLRAEVAETEDLADLRIADMYRNSGGTVPAQISLLDKSGTVSEYGVGEHYAELLAADDRRTIDRLTVQRRDLAEHEDELSAERDAVAEEKEQLAGRKAEVEEAMAARQEALDDARGDIARLVEEERRRRAEEEARRAREALLAQQRAEEEARRRAAAEAELAPDPEDVEGEEPAGPPPPVSGQAALAVEEAREQLGKPYRWGGAGPDSFDCSGLTAWAWAAAGVELPHSSRAQYAMLPHVAFDDVQPGDLLFYGDPIHHVGIYVGNGQMINAPYTGTTVRYDSIYRDDFAGAGRPG